MESKKLWNLSVASMVAASAVVATAPQFAQAADVSFKDMGKSVSSYDAVMNLASRGVISGYEDGTFRPNEEITRGQAAKLLTRILELDTDNVPNPNFKDVPVTHQFYKYIAALSKEGVINGYGDGKYGINDKLTRGQMAIILGNAYKFEKQPLKTNQFKDVNKKASYALYLQALIDNKITLGLTATSFGPAEFVDRGQMAMFLFRSDAVVKSETKTLQISGIKNGKVVTADGGYLVADSLSKLLNETNADALKGAEVSVQLKNNEISSVKSLKITSSGTAAKPLVLDGVQTTLNGNLHITGDNVHVQNLTVTGETTIGETQSKIASVKLAAASRSVTFLNVVMKNVQVSGGVDTQVNFTGTSKLTQLIANANLTVQADTGVVIPSLTVQDGVKKLVLNAAVTEARVLAKEAVISGTGKLDKVIVAGSSKITIELPSKIAELIIESKDAQIQFGDKTTVGNIQLPAGTVPKDVIGNYESVKDKIENVNGKDNPEAKPETPPATGGGGGGGGSVTPTVKTVSTSADLYAALDNPSIKKIILSESITVDKPIVPLAGVTIDGANHTLTLNAKSPDGNNTADGIYIKHDDIKINNLKVTAGKDMTDNLIEVYGNGTVFNKVTVTGSKKAGIYVNNDEENTVLSVGFTNVTLGNNGWKAGIGLQSKKQNSIVSAAFSGENKFEDEVAVYSDSKATTSDKYQGDGNLGQVEVSGLGNVYENPTDHKDNWGEGASDHIAVAKLFADLSVPATADNHTVKLYRDIEVSKPIVPLAGITLDGQEHTLTLNAKSTQGNNTAEGLHIQNDNVTVKNITVTQTGGKNTDNLIEIYGDNAKLIDVKASNSKKAGIYVNNTGDNKELTVSFDSITTRGNEWKAGIGLLAQKQGSKVNATFTGIHSFGDEVAVYTDNNPIAEGSYSTTNYLGTVEVSGLGNVYANPINGKDNWGEGASNEVAGAKLFADIAAADSGAQIDLYRDVTVGKTVYIDKKISLIGGGHTISAASDMVFQEPNKSIITIARFPGVRLSNVKVDAEAVNTSGWHGIYGVQVYKSISALPDNETLLDNVTLQNADAGLLANGSNVTVESLITSGNEFGGIEVSQGAGVTSSSSVRIRGLSAHEENEGVHVWTIGKNASVIDDKNQYKFAKDGRVGKEEFTNYILATEDRDVPYKILEAPKDGLKTLGVDGLNPTDVKYLAFNLTNSTSSAQKIATLNEVAQFLNTTYGANLITNAIEITEGKIKLTGKLLSTQDWNKIKTGGDKNSPYRITVIHNDKTAKIAKIAIYQDGEAVFEPIIAK